MLTVSTLRSLLGAAIGSEAGAFIDHLEDFPGADRIRQLVAEIG